VERLRLIRRSLHAPDGYRSLPLIPFSGSGPGGAPFNGGIVSGDSQVSKLSHSIEDLWRTVSSVTKQASTGESRLENKSENFASRLLASCKAVTHAPLEAISAMTKVRDLSS
jgi:hypothetical protein